ncbi:DnaJ domain-containing protein/DnaJ_CXXCXGXG domain-containing protein/DnaJ_C domain-containing protein [Cephalotus follicularis]|uniref:DnaJ domain-containing protein/DnaJ_CXXCXGXG domain-containing protein/DnaJ_C domain-containing protein n=1 Tax=Cephalotus follicularis TaxID=3775 RepID=A0A1Q3BPI5_CEPFO|nr:DnaJ domain-containing protein/DnaJ_CXXCXGXG domain-containing protein/DnaJ_C domain-containing protein [Cephalotus follicularis]
MQLLKANKKLASSFAASPLPNMLKIRSPLYTNQNLTCGIPPTPTRPNLLYFGFSNSIHSNYNISNGKWRRRGGVIRAAKADYYTTLNVSRNASLQDIKTSYKKLARKYHPDINRSPVAEDKFKEISAAYEVLSDDEKRSLYDRFGEAGLRGEFDGSGSASQVDPFEIFNTFFGGSHGLFEGMGESERVNFNFGNKGSHGLDIRYDLHLTLEESVFGGQREIEISCFETCDNCDGTGAKSSSCLKSCRDCGGRGEVMRTQRTPFGVMSQVSTCFNCSGNGKIIIENCSRCGGNGKVPSMRRMNVVIPPGVYSGAKMQIRGEGNFDKESGFTGDLFIVLHIDEKHGIQRDGLNLYSEININYTEAILGTSIKVETVEGMRDLQIPSGIQPGDTVKLPRMGVPDIHRPSVRGDHNFIVKVLIPKHISKTERALVEELASLKSSWESHSVFFNKSGAISDNFCTDKVGASRKGIIHVASLWNSVKAFLWQRKSQGGFASVCVDTSASLSRFSKPDNIQMATTFMVLVITCIYTLVGKAGTCTLKRPFLFYPWKTGRSINYEDDLR